LVIKGNAESLVNICGASGRISALLCLARESRFAPGWHASPNEASEFSEVIDPYVRAYQTTELDERVARLRQLSDAELMRIAPRGCTTGAATQLPTMLGVSKCSCRANGK
jgi:glutamine synthetase adenylyltransferase